MCLAKLKVHSRTRIQSGEVSKAETEESCIVGIVSYFEDGINRRTINILVSLNNVQLYNPRIKIPHEVQCFSQRNQGPLHQVQATY